MKIDELQQELERIAPDWNWSCEEQERESVDLISPRNVKVFGRNRQTGTETIPIHVSAFPNARAEQLARFICDVLMVNIAAPAGTTQPLMVRN
jgi:hypothetical protein